MKYRVITQPPAGQDIRSSLIWGRDHWGVEQARKWAQGIRKAIASLSTFPERYPLAPQLEQQELGSEVRQMVFQRYRILFTIKGDSVHVLHVRGSFTGEAAEQEEEE